MNIFSYHNYVFYISYLFTFLRLLVVTTYIFSYPSKYEPRLTKTDLRGYRSDTNQAVQPLKMAKDLKFWIKQVEGLYYLCSENKDADQLHS